MAHLNIQARTAIANWRSFHDAQLNKKRKIYSFTYDDKVVCTGKRGALDTGHYILLNLLRGLPADRGYNPEGEAYQHTVASLKFLAGDDSLNRYTEVFGVSSRYLSKLIKETLP